MQKNNVLVIVVAIAMGGGAAYLARSLPQQADCSPPDPRTRPVASLRAAFHTR
jgi:hypothetical protein